MNNRQTYVLFHRDADGFASAFAAWCALGDENVRYISVQYGEPVPDIPDHSIVHIVDFSYNRETLLRLIARGCGVSVLDHHKTAEEELRGLAFAEFDMEKAGVDLAWDYFSRPEHITEHAPAAELLAEPIPQPLKWIGLRDRWLHKTFDESTCADIEALDAYLSLKGFIRTDAEGRPNFDGWRTLCELWQSHADESFLAAGHVCLEFQRQQVERLCKHAIMRHFAGVPWRVPCVNSALWQSEIAHRLLELYPDSPVASVYYDIAKQGVIKRIWSLRSRSGSEVDVSEIARKHYAGGGHKHAAGFEQYLFAEGASV